MNIIVVLAEPWYLSLVQRRQCALWRLDTDCVGAASLVKVDVEGIEDTVVSGGAVTPVVTALVDEGRHRGLAALLFKRPYDPP